MSLNLFIKNINHLRWKFLDECTQKAARISNSLGFLSNVINLTGFTSTAICAHLFNKIHKPILRMIYLFPSLMINANLFRLEDLSKKNWVKKQIKKICLKSKVENKNKKVVYIAASYSDYYFPSSFFDFRTKSNIGGLAKNYDVTFIEAKSEEQLQKKIAALKDQDVDAVIVQAHGCKSLIRFSAIYDVTLSSLEVFKTLANKLKNKANLSLISCSTAEGDDNIAKKISILCSNARIFAPSEEYKISDYQGFKISDDGSCSFKNGSIFSGLFYKRENITKTYQNGRIVA